MAWSVFPMMTMLALGVVSAPAEQAPSGEGTGQPAEAAPAPDPTRGQWDSFLDPLRDFEDNQIVAGQKSIEDQTKVHVGGAYMQAYTWDFNEPRPGTLPLHAFDRHDEPTPTLAQLSFLRPSEGWFIPGFGVKLTAGKAAREMKSDWSGDGAVTHGDTFETANFDAEEAYLTWTVPDDSPALKGLTFKGGKFVTLLGAEVIEPWLNYNYSRSLLFTLAIPITNTGVLMSYPITDKLSVTGGAVAGWDQVASNNDGWTGMGNVTWTASDMVTLAANGIWGPSQNNTVGPKRGVGDLIATIKATDALTLQFNYDYGREQEAALTGGTAVWQGLATIANYNFTDRISAAARAEWFEDHGGSRTGLRQTLWEATLTGKYLITQHLYGRLEYRHDESDKKPFAADDGKKVLAGQDMVGFEVSYVFN
jgi:hypothetical protein